MIKAIIFDCFGVVLTDALQEIRAELARRDPAAAQEVRDIIAANNRGLMQPEESNARIAALLGTDSAALRSQVKAGEVRNKKLLAYILELRKTYKTAMLSNVAVSSLNRRFPEDELLEYFDEVVASAEIGYIKPAHEAYEITAERLGVKLEECVFTDDRPEFCMAAVATGMQAVVYTDFMQFHHDLSGLLSIEQNL